MANSVKLAIAFAVLLLAAAPGQGLAGEAASTAHDFSFEAIDGSGTIELEDFRGKPVLIVNTASFCGFTPQYSGLEALWQRYQDRGVVVLGVPSNDFGGQEPKSEQEIQGFCQGGVSAGCHVLFDARGVDHSVQRQHNPLLGAIERNLIRRLRDRACFFVGVKKLLDDPPPDHRLAPYFRDVFLFDILVEDVPRIDDHNRSALTEAVTARQPEPDRVQHAR